MSLESEIEEFIHKNYIYRFSALGVHHGNLKEILNRHINQPDGKQCDYWNCPHEGPCKNTDDCDSYVVHEEGLSKATISQAYASIVTGNKGKGE